MPYILVFIGLTAIFLGFIGCVAEGIPQEEEDGEE
jgi:hypothetical protein